MSEAFIICLNIERFRELLLSTKDEAQREMLLTLIDEQEQKLAGLGLHDGVAVEGNDLAAPTRRARRVERSRRAASAERELGFRPRGPSAPD